MMQNLPNRTFQIWEYRASHAQLLVRSPKSEKYQTNLDIIFVGVEYISLPTLLNKLSIVEPNATEILISLEFKKGNYTPKAFVFQNLDNRHLVVGNFMKIVENTLHLFDSGLENFNK